jgi:hypothetical protein
VEVPSTGRAGSLSVSYNLLITENIRLGWKCLSAASPLVYSANIEQCEGFIRQNRGTVFTKIYFLHNLEMYKKRVLGKLRVS